MDREERMSIIEVMHDKAKTYKEDEEYYTKAATALAGCDHLSIDEAWLVMHHRMEEAFADFVCQPSTAHWVKLEQAMCGFQAVDSLNEIEGEQHC